MRPRPSLATLLVLVLLALPAAAAAQDAPPAAGREGALRVFVDCGACDMGFVREELTFVDHVREPQDADVHVLVTTQATGSGGRQFTARFVGRGRFAGVEQQLRHASSETDTDATERRGLLQLLKLGLVRYVAETPLGAQLEVTLAQGDGASAAAPRHDPWNAWVFRTGFSGRVSGESAASSTTLSGNLGANRTTRAWKLDWRASADFDRKRFELDEAETFESTSYTLTTRALVVRSLGEHLATGAVATGQSSTYLNYRLRTRTGPALEVNAFPYSASNERLLTLLYSVGWQRVEYREETLFRRTYERYWDHRADLTLALLQTWGTASASVGGSQLLRQRDKYSLSATLGVDLRLFKGLSMNVSGQMSRRRDQINLPRGGASNQQILVRQRELATDYTYSVDVGFSYTFGSIYNNVVNPRFRSIEGA